jgi:acyl-CoA dehydrogenase
MDFELNNTAEEYKKRLVNFMREHIYPIEYEFYQFGTQNPGKIFPNLENLKSKAQKAGLWNVFLPKEYGELSPGLTNVEYATLAEEMGKIPWCSEVFNCSAPDTGNMEVLAKYGNHDQQSEWLTPLLKGKTRSSFLMTEPDVASSDARNIQTSIKRQGNNYIINGIKWWATGAMHPNCKMFIVMGKTNSDADTYNQQSMIIVDKNTPGIEIIRSLPVLNQHDPPGEHCEISLTDVIVPQSNLILGEGRGFEIAQGRLGPGRIHHCMRLIGMAQRSLSYMCKRAEERIAFGRPFKDFSSIRQSIAEAYCEIEQARLLTLKAANSIDLNGVKASRKLIAAIKIVAPKMTCKVADSAMQLLGGKGVSNDTPLAQFYTGARALRLADGPDEVHLDHLGKMLIREFNKMDKFETSYFN